MQIIPTILTSDLKTAQQLLHQISQIPELNWIQADIIDGIFADNQTLTPQYWAPLIKKHPQLKFEAHLMVKDPAEWIQPCLQAGFQRITAQIEMMPSQSDFILSPNLPNHPNPPSSKLETRNFKLEVGFALDLPTSTKKLNPQVLPLLDVILLMSVKAGFGGQKFDPSVLKKIDKLNQLRQQKDYQYQIAIDGGINPSNIGKIETAGANLACIGSSLLKGNIPNNLKNLQ